MSDELCITCERPFRVRWTDTHGVAVCTHCNTPYRLYHYDENDKPVDKPPACELSESGLAIAKRYWAEKQGKAFPCVFDMGILRGHHASYSGCTHDDIEAFHDWYTANYPKEEQAA